jgi:tetratricopeptide (TPR) repeat protein
MGLFGFGKSKEVKNAKYWINKGQEEIFKENPNDENKILYFENALACCNDILKNNPDDNSSLHSKSESLLYLKRYWDVIGCCDQFLEKKIDHEIIIFKSVALSDLGRYEDAIKCYDQALEFGTEDNVDVLADKMSALAYVDRYEDAIKCCDKELKIGTDNDGEIWKCKGNMFSRLGRHEDAIKCYEKSYKNNPDEEIWIYIAFALSKLGLNEQAQNYFDKLDYSNGFNIRANVLFELGRYEDAINQSKIALKINPFMATAYLMIANSLSKLGKYQESILWYDKYIEKTKSSSRVHANDLVFHPKGVALYKLGRKEEATYWWKKSKESE